MISGPIKTKVQLIGLKESDEFLKRLSKGMTKKILMRALKAAASPITLQARLNVMALVDDPRSTGLLARSIGTSPVRMSSRLGGAALKVGVLSKGKGTAKHGHLVEWGTVNMAAQPFLRPAAIQRGAESMAAFTEVLGADMKKMIERFGRSVRRKNKQFNAGAYLEGYNAKI